MECYKLLTIMVKERGEKVRMASPKEALNLGTRLEGNRGADHYGEYDEAQVRLEFITVCQRRKSASSRRERNEWIDDL